VGDDGIGSALRDRGEGSQPDQDVIALTGDGGLLMCLHELHTLADGDIDVTVVVLNNSDYAIISEEAGRSYRMDEGEYGWADTPVSYTTVAEGDWASTSNGRKRLTDPNGRRRRDRERRADSGGDPDRSLRAAVGRLDEQVTLDTGRPCLRHGYLARRQRIYIATRSLSVDQGRSASLCSYVSRIRSPCSISVVISFCLLSRNHILVRRDLRHLPHGR